jgi:hypothetical protein
MASSHLVASLTVDVAEGLRVLRERDGVALTDDQIVERARNIVAGLVGNYFIVELPASKARHLDGCACGQCPIPGRAVGHSWSCGCSVCEEAKRREKRS